MKNILILFLAVIAWEVNASNLPDFPFVTVTGESIKKIEPDEVILGFSVITFDKSASLAKNKLDESSNQVVNLLTKHKISMEDIISYEISKNAKRSRDKDYNDLAILGYEFTQRFEVTINHLSKYSDITNELLDINYVERIESRFDSTKREEVEIELIKNAAQKAKLKAEQMAIGLNVKLDSVFAFNDTGSFSSFFATFGIRSEARAYAMQSMRRNNSNVFVPQYIEIRKSINVIYKLKN